VDPETPDTPEGETPPASSRRSARLAVILIIALAVVVAGFLLLRRGGAGAPGHAPDASKSAPPANAVTAVLVKLTPEAALVADRYNCLCGDCQDTLGRCTCTHHSGSNDMKAVLNRIVAEKKTLAEIDAAMVAQYGPRVLAAAPPSPQPAGK